MSTIEYQAFRADIERRGVQVPLEVTAAGVVIDGRHRLRAARELGIDRLPVRLIEPDDEIGYMVAAALQRRHLSQSQKACIAVEVATLPPGPGRSRERAAQLVGVSPRTMQDAITLHNRDQALFERVKAGEIPAHTARLLLERRHRYQQIGAAPALPAGPFDLILADPPWQLGNPSGDYAPEQHYPTLPTAEIAALKVPAAEDAILFLWVPNGLLPAGLQVIEAWGFTYKTDLVWVKNGPGLGVWLRNEHETLLIGVRGSFPPPEPQRRVSSVVQAPRSGHSAKPEQLYQLLEQMYPHTRRLELYARGPVRPGWSAWGNQVEQAA